MGSRQQILVVKFIKNLHVSFCDTVSSLRCCEFKSKVLQHLSQLIYLPGAELQTYVLVPPPTLSVVTLIVKTID